MVGGDHMTRESQHMSMRLPRQQWLWFATLTLLVVSVGLHFGVSVYRRQVAIREIERIGGGTISTLGGPVWLREVLGESWMKLLRDDVTWVDLSWTDANDGDLMHLGALPEIEVLDLHNTQVNDAGMRHLSGLRNLRIIRLENTWVTDAGAKSLKQKLPALQVSRDW
jgi:hypothetical protein